MAQTFPGHAGLKSRTDEVRLKAARDLKRYVSTELRELPAERYSSSMDDINQSIYSLISSQEVHEKKGGILAIGESEMARQFGSDTLFQATAFQIQKTTV